MDAPTTTPTMDVKIYTTTLTYKGNTPIKLVWYPLLIEIRYT